MRGKTLSKVGANAQIASKNIASVSDPHAARDVITAHHRRLAFIRRCHSIESNHPSRICLDAANCGWRTPSMDVKASNIAIVFSRCSILLGLLIMLCEEYMKLVELDGWAEDEHIKLSAESNCLARPCLPHKHFDTDLAASHPHSSLDRTSFAGGWGLVVCAFCVSWVAISFGEGTL